MDAQQYTINQQTYASGCSLGEIIQSLKQIIFIIKRSILNTIRYITKKIVKNRMLDYK